MTETRGWTVVTVKNSNHHEQPDFGVLHSSAGIVGLQWMLLRPVR